MMSLPGIMNDDACCKETRVEIEMKAKISMQKRGSGVKQMQVAMQ